MCSTSVICGLPSVDDCTSDDRLHLAGPDMNQDLSAWGDYIKKF